jgi:hypothetical protein
MPHEKWRVDVRTRASTRLLDRSRPEEFETFHQVCLVDAIRQLSQLALFSERLFDELTSDCQALSHRSSTLTDRIRQLHQRAAPLNAKTVRVRKYQNHFRSHLHLALFTHSPLFVSRHAGPNVVHFHCVSLAYRPSAILFFFRFNFHDCPQLCSFPLTKSKPKSLLDPNYFQILNSGSCFRTRPQLFLPDLMVCAVLVQMIFFPASFNLRTVDNCGSPWSGRSVNTYFYQ